MGHLGCHMLLQCESYGFRPIKTCLSIQASFHLELTKNLEPLLKKRLLNSWDFYLQTGIFQTRQGEPQRLRPHMLKISTHLLLEVDQTESATTLEWQPRTGSVTDLGPSSIPECPSPRISQSLKANRTSALQPKVNGISNSPTTSNTFLKTW